MNIFSIELNSNNKKLIEENVKAGNSDKNQWRKIKIPINFKQKFIAEEAISQDRGGWLGLKAYSTLQRISKKMEHHIRTDAQP